MLKTTVQTYDGLDLLAWSTEARGSATLVFANAYGVSPDACAMLAARFERLGIRLVTWSGRGTPGGYGPDFASYTAAVHARDMLSVCDALGVHEFMGLGWCSGAHVVLEAVALAPERLRSVILAHPFVSVPREQRTPLGHEMQQTMSLVCQSAQSAALFHGVLAHSGGELSRATSGLPDSLKDIVLAPMRALPEELHRYAAMLALLYKSKADETCPITRAPVLLIGGDEDKITSVEAIQAMGRRIPHCRPVIVAGADHYGALYDEAVMALIERALRSEMPDAADRFEEGTLS